MSFFKNLFGKASDTAGDAMEGAGDMAQSAGEKIMDGAEVFVDSVTGAADAIEDKVRDVIGMEEDTEISEVIDTEENK